jgi:pyrophosphatase PpaX
VPDRDPATSAGPQPRYRCVVFDLDGTLANTIPLIIASYDHALWTILKTHPDPDEARGWIGQTLYGTFSARYPDHAEALITAYIEFNLARLDEMTQPYDGLSELLTELAAAGVSLGVATSKRRPSAEATLRAVGLDGLIPVTVGMEDTLAHKPDPAPLLLAVERLGHSPAESVYIGDAVVDVLAAQAAGMDAVAVTWGAGLRTELETAAPTVLSETVARLRSALLA